MNFIDNIEIKNFKSIRHQKIEGCKRINVFIGYPNVGKSNILEALSLGSYLNDRSDYAALNTIARFDKFKDLFSIGDLKIPFEITFDAHLKLSFEYDNAANLNFRVSESINPDADFNQNIWNVHFSKSENTVAIKSWDYDNRNLKEDKPNFNFNLLKYEFLKNSFVSEQSALHLSFPYGENLFEVLRNNSDLRKDCGALLREYNLKFLFESNNELKITRQIDEDTFFSIPFFQIADTLQRLFFYKTAIFTNKDAVILLEEPESHMFPPYISKFINDIIFDENKNQYFIATHSPFVLNDLMDNLKADELAIYIVSYKKETGETQVHHMSEVDMHEAYQFGYDFFMNIDKFIPQKQHG